MSSAVLNKKNESPFSKVLGNDALAGLTVACIALPLNLALALASGVPASMGLVSGIIAAVVAGLLGGARLQITGPEAALVPIVLVIAQQHGKAGVIVAAIGCGLIQIVLGLARVGRFVRYVPPPVVKGFMAGIGVLILMSQIPVLFGGNEPNMKLHKVIADPQQEHVYGAIVGFVAIGLMMFAGRLGALLALVVTTSAVVLFASDIGIPDVGTLPTELFVPHIPSFGALDLAKLAPLTLSLGLLASLGSLLSAASLEEMVKDRGDKTNYNRELVAQGVTNIVCGFFGGLPVMGAVVRSAASVQAGAQTRATSVFMSIVLLLAVTVGGVLVAEVPIPALAGILVVVGGRLLGLPALKKMWQTEKSQVMVVVVTAGLIATTNFYVGIGGGIALAMLIYVAKVARVTVETRLVGDVPVAEVRGAVVFWGAAKLDAVIPERAPWPRRLVIDLSLVPMIDGAGLYALQHTIACLRVRGCAIALVVRGGTAVATAVTKLAGNLDGADDDVTVHESVSDALKTAVARPRLVRDADVARAATA